MLVSVQQQSIQLKGYSRFSHLTLCNHNTTSYTSFQIKGQPQSEFIVIPQNGALMPGEKKQVRVYLSKGSQRKQNALNYSVEISAWKFNQNEGRDSEIQQLSVPVYVDTQSTIIKSDIRSKSIGSKYGSFNQASDGYVRTSRPKNQSYESSIAQHSSHNLDISPTIKHNRYSETKSFGFQNQNQPSIIPFEYTQNRTSIKPQRGALNPIQISNKYSVLRRDREFLLGELSVLEGQNYKDRDSNTQFVFLCLYISIWLVVGSYLHMVFRRAQH